MDFGWLQSAVFFKFRKVSTFVFKKAMFNLNENNRFVMSYSSTSLSGLGTEIVSFENEDISIEDFERIALRQ